MRSGLRKAVELCKDYGLTALSTVGLEVLHGNFYRSLSDPKKDSPTAEV
jgi:hypothetical protein